MAATPESRPGATGLDPAARDVYNAFADFYNEYTLAVLRGIAELNLEPSPDPMDVDARIARAAKVGGLAEQQNLLLNLKGVLEFLGTELRGEENHDIVPDFDRLGPAPQGIANE